MINRLQHTLSTRWGQPRAWQTTPFKGLRAEYAKNDSLAALQRFGAVYGTIAPESIAINAQGEVYASFEDGRIIQFNAQGQPARTVANTGGRPLGLRFHPDGHLLACDANIGLLRINIQNGHVELLTNSAEGKAFKFADDLDISKDGQMVYFSDASSRWGFNQDHLDIIEARGHGRLLSYNLHSGETKVLMHHLVFANGVTLAADESFVLVVETGKYRIHRYWLSGEHAGQSDIWVDNLPGFPDNIRFNGKDCFWVAIPHARSGLLDKTAALPGLRLCALIYAHYLPLPQKRFSCVLGFDRHGKLLHNLQCHKKDSYHYITQALEFNGELYCSSLKEPSIAKMPLNLKGESHE